MKKSLFRLAASIALLFATFMLAGFAPQDDAAASMEAFVRASLQEDVEGLRTFGATPDLAYARAELARGIRSSSMGYLFSEEQIHRVVEAYKDAAARCDVRARVLSEGKGKACVQVTFEAIDMLSLHKELFAELRKAIPRNISIEERIEAATEYTVNKIRQRKPDVMMGVDISCTYDARRGVWLPDDPAVVDGWIMAYDFSRYTIKEDPDANLEALAAACLHQDADIMERFGMEWEELHATLMQSLMREFQRGAFGRYTEKQAAQVAEAYLASFKKCGVKAVTISEGSWEDMAVVELTIDSLNPVNMEEPIREMKSAVYASEEDLLADYVRRAIEQIEKRKVIGTKTIRLNCTYNAVLEAWQPYNFAEFGAGLYSAANPR